MNTFLSCYCRKLYIVLFRTCKNKSMREIFKNASALGISKFPRVTEEVYQYGTAGFREKADKLNHVMFRMGLLAVLRSKALDGKTVGLMVTASHNPEDDNGVKLCDPSGSMLAMKWEKFATELINSEDDSLPEVLSHIISYNIDYNIPAKVVVGKDTRKSSEHLSQAAKEGINILNGSVTDIGLVTTPQLHYVVCCQNYPAYGSSSVQGYYKKLARAFEGLKPNKENAKYVPEVFVDGANGVGASKLEELQAYLSFLKITVFNDGTEGILNHKCGADFVKFEQREPDGSECISGRRYATVDGDADRLLYYYKDESGKFWLLDGDKIAALFIKYLKELVEVTGLQLRTSVIQTAYANSSSTDFIQHTMGVPVSCVETGVKYLHHEAAKYDVGVYFEANGHGTVLFSEEAKLKIKNLSLDDNTHHKKQAAAKKLLNAIDLINETTGDAISDLLMIEIILNTLDWGVEDWNAIYTELPNRQMKVKVPDRKAIVTTDASRKCVEPEGLQTAIDEAVSKYRKARAFVRSSGTEDVVRVYAEGYTQEQADQLATEVCQLVERFTKNV